MKPDGKKRRYEVGNRVSCAVEDKTGLFTVWAAGTVAAVNHVVSALATDVHGGCVPYEVKLDNGCTVLVHRDEHWLIRDLSLQPEGPRQAADGTRCLGKFGKRKVGEVWEVIDHITNRVRISKSEPMIAD